MASTYAPIATTTLASASSSVDFSSIPSTYTDLVLIVTGTSSGANINYGLRFNDVATSTYHALRLYADGSSVITDRLLSYNNAIISNISSASSTTVIQFNGYSTTTLKKTFISRSNSNNYVWLNAGLWNSNSAINKITFLTTTGYALQPGTTLSLYGIKAA